MVVQKSFVKWIAAAVALLLLFNLPGGCTVRIKGVFKGVLVPVQKMFLGTGQRLKEGMDTIRGFGGLAEENRHLSEEVVHLQARIRVLENLDEENRRLQQQLDFRNQQPRHLISCRVIARTINDWWRSVRIDKGSLDGIHTDRAVISSDGLVGRTSETSAHTADILLISDPSCKVSARVARTGSFGIVTGCGTNLQGYPIARMQFIHKDIPVRTGDTVVTSGLGGVFPKDILIGYIDAVQSEEAGLYQTATIIPKAIVDLMDVVFVSAENEETAEASE